MFRITTIWKGLPVWEDTEVPTLTHLDNIGGSYKENLLFGLNVLRLVNPLSVNYIKSTEEDILNNISWRTQIIVESQNSVDLWMNYVNHRLKNEVKTDQYNGEIEITVEQVPDDIFENL
jgi:hypothetical protein